MSGEIRYSRRSAVLASSVFLANAPALGARVFAQAVEYPELQIVATDHAFEMDATVASGYIRLKLDNLGESDHHAILFRLNDDASEKDFQTALMSGDLGAVLAVTSVYGGPNAGPGGNGTVIAYLDPGHYSAVCVVPDEQGIPHVAHGMVAPLEVLASPADLDEPVVAAEVTLIDMAFVDLPSQIQPGDHTWKVTNGGPQLHEIVVLRLAEPLNPEQLIGILTGEVPIEGGPPPFEVVGGTAPMGEGAVNYLELTLETGPHMAICFIPDAETGMPHFLMGMIARFDVS